MEDTRLLKELILKEEKLLENTFRSDAGKIADIIQEGCVEISASGKLRTYKAGALFENVEGELYIVSNSGQLIDLADGCKLLLYVAGKVHKNSRIKSKRSSVWKNVDGTWKMVFHQGTDCQD